MSLLLDTHVALWAVQQHPRLTPEMVRRIEAADVVFFSAISLVEISIKHALGPRGRDPMLFDARQAADEFRQAGFEELPFTAAHAEVMDRLSAVHGDPFDRMLVAQAMGEPMRLLTSDAVLAAYGPPVEVI